MTRYQQSDIGNAELLRDTHGEHLAYVIEAKQWWAFNGHRWIDDGGMSAMRTAELTAQILTDLGAKHPAGSDEHKKATRWARESASIARLRGMLACAQPMLARSVNEFDAHPYLLNCTNGVVDVKSGRLRPSDPSLLLSKSTGVPYDPSLTCPEFQRVLQRALPDVEQQEFVERYFGLSLIGTVLEHVLAVMIGAGANSKTTICEAVKHALGDYGAMVSPSAIIQSFRDDGPSDAVANLRGRRFVILAETDAGRRLSEASVKLLTGGDTIRARRLYENEIEFRPSHTMVMFTNHRPEVAEGGDGLWRRIRIVPFDVTIPADEQDSHLAERLREEAPGIVTWLVNGCLDYQEHGLPYPDSMKEAGQSYREDEDVVGQFLADCVMELAGYSTPRAGMRAAYKDWCEAAGYRPLNDKRFTAALRDHALKDAPPLHGVRRWADVTLRNQTA